MLIVGNTLVSDELIKKSFCCDLSKCCGACCIEGDVGAPIEPDEIADLEDNYPIFKKYMTEEGVRIVEENGTFDYDMEGEFVTPLLSDEACAFIYYEDGIAKCAIEKAYLNGEIGDKVVFKSAFVRNLLLFTKTFSPEPEKSSSPIIIFISSSSKVCISIGVGVGSGVISGVGSGVVVGINVGCAFS